MIINSKILKRNSCWYERWLLSAPLQFVAGFCVVVLLPSLVKWSSQFLLKTFTEGSINTIIANGISFFLVFFVLRSIRNFPGAQSFGYVFPAIVFIWLVVMTGLLFLKVDYSRHVVIASYLLANLWFTLMVLLRRRYRKLKLAIVPFGKAKRIINVDKGNSTLLNEPSLNGTRFDALVADLHARDLPPEWERFLARCVLSGVPVYHYKQVLESLTGRVKVNHLSENIFGALQPSAFYSILKRFIDVALVLIAVPVWVPLVIVAAIIVKLESKGPAIFKQERIGQGGKVFTVYKLRSMCKDSEKNGAQFAASNDMRVTRVGKFIRKTRIDELPQFFNVLAGSMSLIGPRPEQKSFVEHFEYIVPFYSYRHIVKPGITGWAQVEQGYASDVSDTQVKLEYDFYYIKNISLWLDVLIIFKTVRTIFTGFGAR